MSSSSRVLVLQLDHADPPGRLTGWLTDAGCEVEVVDLAGGAAVPAIDGAGRPDGLVVLGGTMSSGDDARFPYLAGVRALLRDAVSAELPTLAICLGCQLLAAAHGGRVIVNPEGPELGAQLVAKRPGAAADDPLFAELPLAPDVIQWHYDTVSTLPVGAVQLASSPVCENEAFRLGRLAWGVQFHLETTPDVVRNWAAADAAELEGYDLDLILSRSDAAHDDVEQTWRPFVAAFAGVVRDPGAAVAEPAVDPAAAFRAALAGEQRAARSPLPLPTLRPDAPSGPATGA